MSGKTVSVKEAASLVKDGDRIGFGGSWGLARRPVGFVRELLRQGRRGLHVHGILSGIDADLLIAGGAAASTTSSYVGFDEFGQAPHFQKAASAGEIEIHEYSEWLITAGYRATNMGLPYMPWISSRRNDIGPALGLKEIECPFTGTSLLAVRAIEIDVAVIQAVRADAKGNTEFALPIDHMYDVDAMLAHSAKTVIVCAEEVGEIDQNRTQLVGREVDAVVEMPSGGWPGSMNPLYGVDRAHLTDVYLPAAKEGRFDAYLDEYVYEERGAS